MSSSLYWRPPNPEGTYLGYALKFALREYAGDSEVDVTLDANSVPFLRGVIAGTGQADLKQEAQEAINLIEKHGSIIVMERN